MKNILVYIANLFKKKTEKEKLLIQYNKLIEEAFKLSHIDRKASNFKQHEAEELMNQIEQMKEDGK